MHNRIYTLHNNTQYRSPVYFDEEDIFARSRVMATPSNAPPLQDMPPPGGFPKIKITRNLPNRGPHGWVMFAGCGAIMILGLKSFGESNRRRRDYKLEKRLARIALVPLLQAELDQMFFNDYQASRMKMALDGMGVDVEQPKSR